MPTYHHRLCDRSGIILYKEEIELPDLKEALIHANMNVRSLIGRTSMRPFDPKGRIDIADSEGHPVGRVYCAEVIAASS
jgi:hypothetical protein